MNILIKVETNIMASIKTSLG